MHPERSCHSRPSGRFPHPAAGSGFTGAPATPIMTEVARRRQLPQEFSMAAPDLDPATRTELEAAAFRRLVAHLRERTDVQNIDMMNLAGFCRNCLSRWYREEAAE